MATVEQLREILVEELPNSQPWYNSEGKPIDPVSNAEDAEGGSHE